MGPPVSRSPTATGTGTGSGCSSNENVARSSPAAPNPNAAPVDAPMCASSHAPAAACNASSSSLPDNTDNKRTTARPAQTQRGGATSAASRCSPSYLAGGNARSVSGTTGGDRAEFDSPRASEAQQQQRQQAQATRPPTQQGLSSSPSPSARRTARAPSAPGSRAPSGLAKQEPLSDEDASSVQTGEQRAGGMHTGGDEGGCGIQTDESGGSSRITEVFDSPQSVLTHFSGASSQSTLATQRDSMRSPAVASNVGIGAPEATPSNTSSSSSSTKDTATAAARGGRALVWTHFRRSGWLAVCNFCDKVYKFSGGTSTLRRHLALGRCKNLPPGFQLDAFKVNSKSPAASASSGSPAAAVSNRAAVAGQKRKLVEQSRDASVGISDAHRQLMLQVRYPCAVSCQRGVLLKSDVAILNDCVFDRLVWPGNCKCRVVSLPPLQSLNVCDSL